jgi:SAM-dependent methyltransferase
VTLPPGYFRDLWAQDDDPWHIADRFYERRKRDLVLASLPRARFGTGFELGCAAGHLSAGLAERCARLLCWDVDERAVALTRERVPEAQVEQRAAPHDWPTGAHDLVVVSEVGYYLGSADLARLARRAVSGTAAGGVLLACHWRHEAPDYPSTAEEVHGTLADAAGADGLARAVGHVEPDLLLDVWVRGEPSVAAAEGWWSPRPSR